MDEKNKLLLPNSTQIPNIIIDLLIPEISEAEARCLLYICRRTFGFRKNRDQIAFSQFTDGIINRRGERLDFGTGLKRKAVNIALKHLVESGAVAVSRNSKGNYYRINLEMDVKLVVQKMQKLREIATFKESILKEARKKVVSERNQNQFPKETDASLFTIPTT